MTTVTESGSRASETRLKTESDKLDPSNKITTYFFLFDKSNLRAGRRAVIYKKIGIKKKAVSQKINHLTRLLKCYESGYLFL